MATQTGPESTLSQDLDLSVPQGGCACAPARRTHRGPRTTFEDCACDWGKFIRQMMYLGYAASTLEAAHNLAELGGNINVLACRRRREILQDKLDSWTGTTTAFCEAYQITRAKLNDLGLKRKR